MKQYEFMESLLKSVPKYGWTIDAMRDASVNLGLDQEYHQIFFEGGVSEARQLYEELQDIQMLEILGQMPYPEKIRQRIALALKVRIIDLDDGYYKSPMTSIWRTVDEIWRYAGDTSADFNYYTKRSLLAAVYIKSKKSYSRDTSENYQNTHRVIKQSIEKVLKIATLKRRLTQIENIPILRLFF